MRWSSSEDSPEVASLQLVPRQHLGEHDFLPNDFVVKRLEESSDVGVMSCVEIVASTSTPSTRRLLGAPDTLVDFHTGYQSRRREGADVLREIW